MTSSPTQRQDTPIHRDEQGESTNPRLAAALDYARRGLLVLPLHPHGKAPDGTLVRHGLREASGDPKVLRAWWSASPEANVGLRTGRTTVGRDGPAQERTAHGLDVVDLDSARARLALEGLAPSSYLPEVLVRTGHGWHLWFAASGLRSRVGVLDEVDVRGEGGYVVAPPSRHESGATYRFVDLQSGKVQARLPQSPLPVLPSWLSCLLAPPEPKCSVEPAPRRLSTSTYVRVAIESECAAVAATREGGRNDRLNRAAFSLGTLVGAHLMDGELARELLLGAATRAGLPEREARRTIASGLTAGERSPRRLVAPGRSGFRVPGAAPSHEVHPAGSMPPQVRRQERHLER